MGIEQHLMTLLQIGHQPKSPTERQLDMRHLQTLAQPANDGVLTTPVKLERLTRRKAHRYIGLSLRRMLLELSPLPDKGDHPVITAGVTLRLQGQEHEPAGTPIPLGPVAVRLEPTHQLLFIRVQNTRGSALGILRLDHF